jgi:hypothetical protein
MAAVTFGSTAIAEWLLLLRVLTVRGVVVVVVIVIDFVVHEHRTTKEPWHTNNDWSDRTP